MESSILSFSSNIPAYLYIPKAYYLARSKGTKETKYCSVALCVDKEEVGSIGATGAQSKWFENVIAELIALQEDYSDLKLRHALTNTKMLSSDVSAGYDPNYPGVFERKNSAYLGHGLALNKYTGARGKSGCNDANPEFRRRFHQAKH